MGKVIGKLTKTEGELFKANGRCKQAVKEVVRAAVHEYENSIAAEEELWELVREKFGKQLTESEAGRMTFDHITGEVSVLSEADAVDKTGNVKKSVRLLWEKSGKLTEI